MNKFSFVFTLIFLISSCAPAPVIVPPTESPTIIPTSTNTSTPLPTLTPTFTPTPTLSLPVSYLTSIPSSNSKINVENLKDLKEIARYYGEMYFTAALSGDHKLLFVRDPLGIDVYDYPTNQHLNHVDLPGSSRGGSLQVDANSEWIFVDDTWLVHLAPEKEPEIQNLYSVLPLKEGNRFRESNISLDSHKFVNVEIRCDYNGCNIEDLFQIISLPDMHIIYSWGGGYNDMHGQNPVFSPDGSLMLTRVENQIIIWRSSDQTQVAAIKNIQGNSQAVFSNDSSLIAIGQLDTVQIWNVLSGEIIQTIKGLCGDLNDPPQPILLNAKRIVILECPYKRDKQDRQEGNVSVWKVSDATSVYKDSFGPITSTQIIFEEDKDRVNVLKNPRNVAPWIFPRVPDTIKFLDNGDLTFVQTDDQLRNMACIIKPNGTANCSENVMLGTDDQFYTYAWQDGAINLYRGLTISGSLAYSVCCQGNIINALDPINRLFFYTVPSRGLNNSSKSGIIGLEDDRFRMGESSSWEIDKVSFSGDKKFAAACRRLGGPILFDVVDRDKLVFFDLSQKTVIFQQPFTCLNTPFILTENGSRLIASSAYIGQYGYARHKLLIMNTVPPIQRKIIDIGCDNFNALTLSSDESFLVIACNDGTLRFLNPDTAEEIYRQANVYPDLWGLAFSKDGTTLAMASKRGFISLWAISSNSP